MTPSARVIRELLGDSELHRNASPAVVAAFIELRHTLANAEHATAKRDGIERDLLTHLGYPRVLIPDGTPAAPRYAASLGDLDRLLAEHPGASDLRRQLRLELRTRQQEWRQKAQASGLTAALRAEERALQALTQTTVTLLGQPISTVVDAALVLAVIIACGKPGPAEAETFPWRELRKLFTALSEL